ncbi:type I restriction enzyme EcoKI subunit R [Azoarcus sp. Aa7]|nr:type I restriction enzyme EcoKI subunit R [Azoarcus sp. Aa7]
MNEAETRAEHIDPVLAAAGWGVVDGSRIRREYPITPGRLEGAGKRGKALTADYVLEFRNTKLAVVEAKAWDKPLTEGVGQAKDYATETRRLESLYQRKLDALDELKRSLLHQAFSGRL